VYSVSANNKLTVSAESINVEHLVLVSFRNGSFSTDLSVNTEEPLQKRSSFDNESYFYDCKGCRNKILTCRPADVPTLASAHDVSVGTEKLSLSSGNGSFFAVELATKGLYGLVHTAPRLIQ